MESKERSIIQKFSPHLFEAFVVYGIVLTIIGLLKKLVPTLYKDFDYLIVGACFLLGTFIIWTINKRKEKELIIKNENDKKLLKIAKWKFLLDKDDDEQKAILDLFNVAKIKGLFDNESLYNEIKTHFLKSNKVKIKVTRGFNLFFDDGTNSEQDIFHHCIYEVGKDQKREIELLLHYPCLIGEHTINRAKANHISPEGYVKSLFQVIQEIKRITKTNQNKNEISVRFYNDYEIKWRYYLFVDAQTKEKTLFLNYYDNKKTGADSAMLKIEFGAGTLCHDFDSKFDEIFTNSKFSKEIVSNQKDKIELNTQHFCEHPDCAKKIVELYSDVFQVNSN